MLTIFRILFIIDKNKEKKMIEEKIFMQRKAGKAISNNILSELIINR